MSDDCCGCYADSAGPHLCADHRPRHITGRDCIYRVQTTTAGSEGEVMLTYSTGDSPMNLLLAAADIINDEMDSMDVDNLTMQVRHRNYKRVRDALRDAAPVAAQGVTDSERLDWLEEQANGHPIEIDSFTGLRVKDGEAPGSQDAVFLTTYPATDGVMCDRFGCQMNHVCKTVTNRLGQGRTLRAAIDAALTGGDRDGK